MSATATEADVAGPLVLTRPVLAVVDLAGLLVTDALLALATAHVGGPVRILLALAFVTFVPGWAAFGHFSALEPTSRLALAVAVSLTLCTALAQGLLWLSWWDPMAMLYGLGAASVAVLLLQLGRSARDVR